jgi:hypothetical protein
MSRKTGRPSPNPKARAGTSPATARVRAAIALLVAAGVGLFVGVQVGSPSATDASIASIRADEARRDAAQIIELTALARDTSQELTPVVAGLRAALPATEGAAAPAAQPVSEQDVTRWRQIMDQQVERHKATPSGSTATNVARGGLRNAVSHLQLALETFAAARRLPADRQQPLLVLASRQRALAVNEWSVAATQLDQINIDSGNGHQHVYLSDQSEGGAMTGDGAPEGSS